MNPTSGIILFPHNLFRVINPTGKGLCGSWKVDALVRNAALRICWRGQGGRCGGPGEQSQELMRVLRGEDGHVMVFR